MSSSALPRSAPPGGPIVQVAVNGAVRLWILFSENSSAPLAPAPLWIVRAPHVLAPCTPGALALEAEAWPFSIVFERVDRGELDQTMELMANQSWHFDITTYGLGAEAAASAMRDSRYAVWAVAWIAALAAPCVAEKRAAAFIMTAEPVGPWLPPPRPMSAAVVFAARAPPAIFPPEVLAPCRAAAVLAEQKNLRPAARLAAEYAAVQFPEPLVLLVRIEAAAQGGK